jgi:hypothetical protein
MHVRCRQVRPRTVTFLGDGMARQLTPGGTSFSELLDKVARGEEVFRAIDTQTETAALVTPPLAAANWVLSNQTPVPKSISC